MNKFIGSIFCLISALLTSARYLSAAIYINSSGLSNLGPEEFQRGLSFIGSPLMIASVISLVVGILFIVYGIYQDVKKDKSSH